MGEVPTRTDKSSITWNEIFDHFWDIEEYRSRRGTPCVKVPFEEWLKFLESVGQKVSDRVVTQLYRGCIGLCSVYQQCTRLPPYVGYPEKAPLTTCFLEKKDAEGYENCPAGYGRFIFAKQGEWRNGEPHVGKGKPVPIDSVVGKGGGDSGLFNYITVGGGYCIWMNHCKKDQRTGKCTTDLSAPADPKQPQVMTICKSSTCKAAGYPATMWCVTCRKCK